MSERGESRTPLKSIVDLWAVPPGPILSDTCIWTNFAGVCSTRMCGVAAQPIYYTKFPHLPSLFCQIAWIAELKRGRRVNISPHVKPRAGKNVSTWVPWLVLACFLFAPFFPGPLSLPIYLSSAEGGSFNKPDKKKEGLGFRKRRRRRRSRSKRRRKKEEEEGERETHGNEMDESAVLSTYCVKVVNAASTDPSVRS